MTALRGGVVARAVYAPVTRALEQFWLCRSVAGSGDAAEPGVYQHLYLKSDLEYVCHGS